MGHFKRSFSNGILYDFCKSKNSVAVNSISGIKSEIEATISNSGLILRLADLSDIRKLSLFQKEIFYPLTATLENEYELFRIIKFGYALLIENKTNELLGCYTTIHYGTEKKDGYGVRVGVSPKIAGNNFAAQLAKYATILAYENGCRNFSALMSPTNFRSAANVLNHVGYYCEKFHRDLPSFGTRFEITLALNPESFFNTEIDFNKVTEFIKKAKINRDFLLIKPSEIDKMEAVYSEANFKIIAFLKRGIVDDQEYFLAIQPFNT